MTRTNNGRIAKRAGWTWWTRKTENRYFGTIARVENFPHDGFVKTTRKNTTTTPSNPTVYRIGCWHEDAPVRMGAYRLLIVSGDTFGTRFVGGELGADLATTKPFIVFNGEVDARECFNALPVGLTVEFHKYDGVNWRNVGAGVVQPNRANSIPLCRNFAF